MTIRLVHDRRDEPAEELGTLNIADRPHRGDVIETKDGRYHVLGVRFPACETVECPAPAIVTVEALPLPVGMQPGAPIMLLEAAKA